MRAARVALISTMLLAPGQASAELPPLGDEVFEAVRRASLDLAAGASRAGVLDDLDRAIAAHPESEYLEHARRLRSDLAFSIESAGAGRAAAGEGVWPTGPDLMETRIPRLALEPSGIVDPALEGHVVVRDPVAWFLAENPEDPMSRVLGADRGIIESLIPLLDDPSPTRYYEVLLVSGWIPSIPRVSDVALFAIEYHSQCRFRRSSDEARDFHQLPSSVRRERIENIREWWAENRSKSLAEGIRAQLPHTDFAGQVWMASNLAALPGEREVALEHLRSLVRRGRGSSSAYAAETLARLGDLSGVDALYERWKHVGNVAGDEPFPSSIVFFLTSRGGRREWELLHRIAEIEVRDGLGPGTARIYPAVVRSGSAATCPWAIPTLALALKDTDFSGSRSVEGAESQRFAFGDEAAERLQDLTGVDFGYHPAGSEVERLSAIDRARAWWEAEGRERYTFDFIATLVEARDGGCPEPP